MQQVKDPALSLLWSLLWHGFNPWSENFHMLWAQPKKKKKRENVDYTLQNVQMKGNYIGEKSGQHIYLHPKCL